MLSDFDFNLPPELIAQNPLERGQARLIVCDAHDKNHEILFHEIQRFFSEGDTLVLNNTKVLPALLEGTVKGSTVKINLVNKCPGSQSEKWECLSKPRKKLELGEKITFAHGLEGTVVEKFNQNNMDVIEFNATAGVFLNLLDQVGQMPIPPYIKRKPSEADKINYQTVFSQVPGSVAAPTAGLHFDLDLLERLKNKGVKIVYVTLHVGSGTFLPVRCEKLADHKMHTEFYSIDQAACDTINQSKLNNNRVVAVGTTVARTLESAANFCGADMLYGHSHHTNLFIKENYKFAVVDGLVTNFHLPKSTLFVLVCSFLGSVEKGQKLYQYAIERKYRFFSYGDACFLIKR